MGSNMSQARYEKLLALQQREESKPRLSTRSKSQASFRGNSRPVTGQLPPPSRPATGMSMYDCTNPDRPYTGAPSTINEEYYHDEGPPPKTAATENVQEEVVDEWALLNELDITSYQLEQEKRRQIEAAQKAKVKIDLMNQMREKSQSQQMARTVAEQEWREQKERLEDWNEQERKRADKKIRRMERRRQMLLKQMEVAQQSRKTQKERELDEGKQIAAQIREDMHEERERAKHERVCAMEEFRLQCEENDMLQMLKAKDEEAAENKAAGDLDRYFSKKEQEELQRQKEIADRYNSCRLRERKHAEKVEQLDHGNTYHKKTDEELELEMEEATQKFDEKDQMARAERHARKKDALGLLDRQVQEKEHRRRMEFNEALQTVGDMRDAVIEHEEEERHNRIRNHLEKKDYGKQLQQQRRMDDKAKVEFVRGMSSTERRINLPLLEKLRDAAAPALVSRPNTGSVAPFSERSGARTPNPVGGQFAKAKKIVRKMTSTSVKFG